MRASTTTTAGEAVLHYGCDDEEAEHASRYAVREQAAERARLVYVALTRAVYRCYLVAGTYLSSRSTKESRRSVLNWLVGGSGHSFDDWLAEPPDEAALSARWQALAGGPITLQALPQWRAARRWKAFRTTARRCRRAPIADRCAISGAWRASAG